MDGSSVAKLKMPYGSGEFSFEAHFEFDDHGLSTVALDLQSGPAFKLDNDLKAKYGAPFGVSPNVGGGVEKWNVGVDEVMLLLIGDHATIYYSPRIDADNKGL